MRGGGGVVEAPFAEPPPLSGLTSRGPPTRRRGRLEGDSFFFVVQIKMSWCTLLIIWHLRTSRSQGSELPSATRIPQMTVVAILTCSEDYLAWRGVLR